MTNLDNFLSLPIITQRNRRGTGLDSQGIVILCHLSQISLLFGYFILKRMQKGPQCQELSRFKAGLWQSWQSERGYSLLSSNMCHQDGKSVREDEGKRVLVWLWCALCHPCLLSKPKILHSHPQQPCLPASSSPVYLCPKPTPGWGSRALGSHLAEVLKNFRDLFPFFSIEFCSWWSVGDERQCL